MTVGLIISQATEMEILKCTLERHHRRMYTRFTYLWKPFLLTEKWENKEKNNASALSEKCQGCVPQSAKLNNVQAHKEWPSVYIVLWSATSNFTL